MFRRTFLKKKTYWIGLALFVIMISVISSHAAIVRAADSQWRARYWNNRNLSGDPVIDRHENNLDHDWGDDTPDLSLNKDAFSARWNRSVNFPAGNYRFTATMDDGMRVWVDNNLIIDSWTDSQVHSQSGDIYLNSGDHAIKVEYYEAGGKAVAKLNWAPIGGLPTVTPVPGSSGNGSWHGDYFNNKNLSGNPTFSRDDSQINFNWGGGSPGNGRLNNDNFSIRWTRTLNFVNGRYRFTVNSDDGVRVWANNQLIIDAWNDHTPEVFNGEINLPAGNIPIRVEYYENTGGAQVQLNWTILNAPPPQPTPIPSIGSGTVTTGRLNVRTGPGVQFPITSVLNNGQTVSLAGYRSADGNWVMINWSGGNAWVSGRPALLQTNVNILNLPIWQGSVPNTGGPQSNPMATVSNAANLNLRSGPSTTTSIITTAPRGSQVTLLGRNAASSWAMVRLPNGTTGWMSAYYLTSTTPIAALPLTG